MPIYRSLKTDRYSFQAKEPQEKISRVDPGTAKKKH